MSAPRGQPAKSDADSLHAVAGGVCSRNSRLGSGEREERVGGWGEGLLLEACACSAGRTMSAQLCLGCALAMRKGKGRCACAPQVCVWESRPRRVRAYGAAMQLGVPANRQYSGVPATRPGAPLAQSLTTSNAKSTRATSFAVNKFDFEASLRRTTARRLS